MSGFALTRSGSSLTLTGRIVNAGVRRHPHVDRFAGHGHIDTQPRRWPWMPAGADGRARRQPCRTVTLTENARLEPGGTVDLTLHFQRAGDVQVFTSFTDG